MAMNTYRADNDPPFCHPDSEWICLGCERLLCQWCDGIPSDEFLCWTCINEEDPETAA